MRTIGVPQALLVSSRSAQPLDADTAAKPAEDQAKQPAFITTQTLATFSGASAVATFGWKVLAGLAGDWAQKRWVPFAISALIGIWLILKAFENAKKPSDYYGAVLVGLVNTAQIWVAVIGLDVVLDTTVGVEQTGGTTP